MFPVPSNEVIDKDGWANVIGSPSIIQDLLGNDQYSIDNSGDGFEMPSNPRYGSPQGARYYTLAFNFKPNSVPINGDILRLNTLMGGGPRFRKINGTTYRLTMYGDGGGSISGNQRHIDIPAADVEDGNDNRWTFVITSNNENNVTVVYKNATVFPATVSEVGFGFVGIGDDPNFIKVGGGMTGQLYRVRDWIGNPGGAGLATTAELTAEEVLAEFDDGQPVVIEESSDLPVARQSDAPTSVDIVAENDIDAGDVVVLGDLITVAKRPLKKGEFGALAIEDVFDVNKRNNDDYELGDDVYWHVNQKVARTNSGNNRVFIGHAIELARDVDNTVRVRFNNG